MLSSNPVTMELYTHVIECLVLAAKLVNTSGLDALCEVDPTLIEADISGIINEITVNQPWWIPAGPNVSYLDVPNPAKKKYV